MHVSQEVNFMKALGRIALMLILCFVSAQLVTAGTEETSGPSPLKRSQNSNSEFVRTDNSLSTSLWSWFDLACLSSLAQHEILRFEIPNISRKNVTKRRWLQEDDLLVQEEITPAKFDPDDLIVSVTFSEICKSREQGERKISQ